MQIGHIYFKQFYILNFKYELVSLLTKQTWLCDAFGSYRLWKNYNCNFILSEKVVKWNCNWTKICNWSNSSANKTIWQRGSLLMAYCSKLMYWLNIVVNKPELEPNLSEISPVNCKDIHDSTPT